MGLDNDGYEWAEISVEYAESILSECKHILGFSPQKFGLRNVLSQSSTLASLVETCLLPIANEMLDGNSFIVRSTLFDKPMEANWAVPWHQDVTIEVKEKKAVDGFGPWSVKDRLISVQPPSDVLAGMVTLRLHLDAVDESNGALWVDPGSHLLGKLRIEEINPQAPISCCGKQGSVLVMKPLLFHASNHSLEDRPRRVLHLDFAKEPLPPPLAWRDDILPAS
jgi:ectoine hydroxylase-related dioxygenase (phytanoyl-CoA dioxygenase family)